MAGYALDNSWSKAKRRLALLEFYLDPKTKRRALALGLAHGWRCLEVGAGGGSIALWLSEQVGMEGRVVATDINPTLLEELERPNLKTRHHDILNEPLPEGDFDLVHARWILHHLPTPEIAISRMVSALRPGGWLLLEEVDFFPVHASENADYRDFMTALVNTVVKASGRDCFWARALPGVVTGQGLSNVSGEGDFSLLQGGLRDCGVLCADGRADARADACNRRHRCGKNGSRTGPIVPALLLGVWRWRGIYLGPASRMNSPGIDHRGKPDVVASRTKLPAAGTGSDQGLASLKCRNPRRPLDLETGQVD
jgi:SAM-dependent methyltransferase